MSHIWRWPCARDPRWFRTFQGVRVCVRERGGEKGGEMDRERKRGDREREERSSKEQFLGCLPLTKL